MNDALNMCSTAERAELRRPADSPLRGSSWRIATSALRLLVQVVVTAILAHLLGPGVLGLLALAVVVTGFSAVISGVAIESALIQRSLLTAAHLRVGFTLSLITGTLAIVILWILAPAAALFFRNPEVVPVLRFVSLGLFFESIGSVSHALVLRQLDFKREFWSEACGNLIGYAGVGLSLTLLNYGVWAPAAGLVARSLVRSTVLLVMTPPPTGLLLSRRETSEVLHFGAGVSLGGLANFVATNADYIVVGTWLGAEALGLYQYAYQIGHLPVTYITVELSYVLFPALAGMRDDPTRAKSAYHGALVLVMLITLPSAVAIAISGPELISVVLGERWVRSVVPLQIFCVVGAFQAAYNLADALAKAHGIVYQQAARHLAYAVAVLAGSALGLRWDLPGVSMGVAAAIVLICFLMLQLTKPLLGSTWLDIAKMHAPGAAVALATGALGVAASQLGRGLQLSPAVTLALTFTSCAIGALVAALVIPMFWLGADVTMRLVEAAQLIPHNGMRTRVLGRLQR